MAHEPKLALINLTWAITLRPKSNLEGYVWSYKSITGVISQSGQFLASGLLDVFLSEYPDESHNFRNLTFYDITL